MQDPKAKINRSPASQKEAKHRASASKKQTQAAHTPAKRFSQRTALPSNSHLRLEEEEAEPLTEEEAEEDPGSL